MGTRADFYLGKNKDAKWIGSIAWDGYADGIPKEILEAKSESDFQNAVSEFLAKRDDATLPEDGWPWPWSTSGTTDCSYWFFNGEVFEDCGKRYAPCRLKAWSCEFEQMDGYEEVQDSFEYIDYPVFERDKIAPTGSKRSGVILTGF